MKNLKKILLVIITLTLLISCDKDENMPQKNIDEETISAKWSVSSTSDYNSFEFNESGNYIVVKNTNTKSTNNQIILFGTYEIVDNTIIVLSDFGTLIISDINDNSISFSIQLTANPSDDIIINASKHEEIENTNNTELLCRTWEVVSFGGIIVSDFVILFSDAGTYFVDAIIDGVRRTGLGTWMWCNSDETKLAFTIDYELNCDGIEIIKEIQLSSDSFSGINMENVEPMVIVMEPVSSTKSAHLVKQKTGKIIFGVKE